MGEIPTSSSMRGVRGNVRQRNAPVPYLYQSPLVSFSDFVSPTRGTNEYRRRTTEHEGPSAILTELLMSPVLPTLAPTPPAPFPQPRPPSSCCSLPLQSAPAIAETPASSAI